MRTQLPGPLLAVKDLEAFEQIVVFRGGMPEHLQERNHTSSPPTEATGMMTIICDGNEA